MIARPIFLDGQATTPLDPLVAEAMAPFNQDRYGNPHSLDNAYGRDVAEAIEEATGCIADCINADPHEVFFTSGATESNNWLVYNILAWGRLRKIHIILPAIEHASLLAPIHRLPTERVEVSYLETNREGLVSVKDIEACLQDNTVLVSVMAVNNEIGAVQPLKEIGELCARNGIMFHSDAAQAIGKIPFDVTALNLDFVSLSSHKTYGPMGIGAMFVSEPHIKRFEPMIIGGGQQKGLRSGTLPVSLCVGMGAAFQLASQRWEKDEAYLLRCRNRLLDALAPYRADIEINGGLKHRVSGNLNLQFRDKLAEHFLVNHPELAISLGSACKAAANENSHVLEAIGLSSEQIERSFRVSFSRTITIKEVELLAEVMVSYLRRPHS